jgi:hypothetical protein
MKRILITTLATLLVFTTVLFNACKPEKCAQISCAFGGTCKDGNCVCQVGYEGEHCETITRDKFKGQWNVNEDGTLSSPAQFTASIEDGAMINQVVIKNFQNVFGGENVIGIAYKDTLTIPLQTMADGSKIKGYATIVDTNPLNQHYYQHAVMTMYFEVTNPAGTIVNLYGSGGAGPSLWAK